MTIKKKTKTYQKKKERRVWDWNERCLHQIVVRLSSSNPVSKNGRGLRNISEKEGDMGVFNSNCLPLLLKLVNLANLNIF